MKRYMTAWLIVAIVVPLALVAAIIFFTKSIIDNSMSQGTRLASSIEQQVSHAVSSAVPSTPQTSSSVSASASAARTTGGHTSTTPAVETPLEKALKMAALAGRWQRALNGVSGSGRVIHVKDLHTVLTGPPTLAVTGTYGAEEYGITLRVRIPGHQPYVAVVTQPVASAVAAQLVPGAVVSVQADPRQPSDVLVA